MTETKKIRKQAETEGDIPQEIDENKFDYETVLKELEWYKDFKKDTVGEFVYKNLELLKKSMEQGFDGTLVTLKHEQLHKALDRCRRED